MLLQEEQAVAVPQISTHLLLSQATQEVGKEVAKQGIRILGKQYLQSYCCCKCKCIACYKWKFWILSVF